MLVRAPCGSYRRGRRGGKKKLIVSRKVTGKVGAAGKKGVGGGGKEQKPCDSTKATCSVLLCRLCPRAFDMI